MSGFGGFAERLRERVLAALTPTLATLGALALTGGEDGQAAYVTLVRDENGDYAPDRNTLREGTTDDVLRKLIQPDLLAVVLVSGPGIISVALTGALPSNLLEAVLPGAKAAEFYTEARAQANGATFITAARTETAEAALERLQATVLRVDALALGAGRALNLAGSVPEGRYGIGDQVLVVDTSGGALGRVGATSFSPTPTPELVLDGQQLPSVLLPAIALALGATVGDYGPVAQVAETTRVRTDASRAHRLLLRVAPVLALVLLLSLGGSAYFQKRTAALQQTALTQRDALLELESADRLRDDGAAYLNEFGLGGESLAPYYANQLLATLPAGVTLSALTVFPEGQAKGGRPDPDELPSYASNTVELAGSAEDVAAYLIYRGALSDLPIVARFEDRGYRTTEDGEVTFEASLTLADPR